VQTLEINVLKRVLVPPFGSVTGYIHLPFVPRRLCSWLPLPQAHARSYCASLLSISSFFQTSGLDMTTVIFEKKTL
jgi:hypothetical protein